MIKSLKELSELPSDQIKIVDKGKLDLYPLRWTDHIIIMYGGLSKTVTRRTAYKFGLCEGVPVKQMGGYREGSGRKPLVNGEIKHPITLFVEEKTIAEFGGKERLKKILYNCLKQRI